jgi:hypothetical protein
MAIGTGLAASPAIKSDEQVLDLGDWPCAIERAVMLRGAWAEVLRGTLFAKTAVVLSLFGRMRGRLAADISVMMHVSS